MKVKIVDETEEMLREMSGRVMPRSPGLHVSEIWRDLEEAVIKKHDKDITEYTLSKFALGGLMWERILSYELEKMYEEGNPRYIKWVEFIKDGCHGTPDIIDLKERTVIDTKFRWMSVNKIEALEENFWTEIVQLKAYCYMVGFRKATLLVYFVMGDYRGNFPQIKKVELEFGQHELEENWRMLMNHRKNRGDDYFTNRRGK